MPDPFEMLYSARWNVPRAAQAMGLPACEASWEQVKRDFSQWTVSRPLLPLNEELYYIGGEKPQNLEN